ncbi:MAG: lipoate--protein ligase family protein [Firmicutes bacterium]|nr:lipoate--protein ligase family protein [Bacillota bacterium]
MNIFQIDRLRVITDGVLNGAMNMAYDEALMSGLSEGNGAPTLRFYSWEKPTLSLGYFQEVADVLPDKVNELGAELVRRPTGGRAVLHWQEVTFCVVLNANQRGLWEIFRSIHECIGSGLNISGIPAKVLPITSEDYVETDGGKRHNPACFASPSRYELTLNGKKIAGSAQKKYGDFMLIHGSIPIQPNFDKLFEMLAFETEDQRKDSLEKALSKMTSLKDEMKTDYDEAELTKALIRGFEEQWGCTVYSGNYSEEEEKKAKLLYEEKYSKTDWIYRKP